MKYGSIKTVTPFGEDSEVAEIELIHGGEVHKRYRLFTQRQIVKNQKQETAAYLQYAAKIKSKRDEGMLAIIDDKPETIPRFEIKYPKKNVDDSYMVITSWAEKLM